jgi:hypothetical protein
VRHVDHVAYHRLFGPGLPHVIADIINEIWIDPEYELVVRRRKTKKDRRRREKRKEKPVKKKPVHSRRNK